MIHTTHNVVITTSSIPTTIPALPPLATPPIEKPLDVFRLWAVGEEKGEKEDCGGGGEGGGGGGQEVLVRNVVVVVAHVYTPTLTLTKSLTLTLSEGWLYRVVSRSAR